MAQSDRKKNYDKEYRRTKMTAICIRLSNEADAELLKVWAGIENKAEWFRQKLREEKQG